MAPTDATRQALRKRLGPVGVWRLALGSAADERATAAELERLGYGAIWFGEGPVTKEAFTEAGLLLAASRTIAVATGIANLYARDATAMNNGALALAEAYPGRFLLGLGVSHAPAVARRGHDYGKPIATMRAYLDAMDAAPYGAPPPAEPLPRVLAALRPKMLALAAARTEGAHPYLVTPEHTKRARAALGAGPVLAPEQGVVLESDPGRAREIARRHLERYLALENYCNNFRDLGFGDGDFANGGSDRLVDALIAWGDAAAIAARVRAHHQAGADHVCVQAVDTDLARQRETLRTLAPVLLGKR